MLVRLMTEPTLEQRREALIRRLDEAKVSLAAAENLRDRARQMGGGLLSFGGSGSQRAKTQVQTATDRGLRAWAEAQTKVEHLERDIRMIENRIAERDRIRLTRDDLRGATHVRLVDGGWWRVARLNRTTVAVETGYSWTDKHEFHKIAEARAITEQARPSLRPEREK